MIISKISHNQEGKIGYILTGADRRSDSCFDCGISGAWLHVTGAKPLKIKKLAHDHPMLFMPLKAKGQIVDTCKA